MAVRARARLEVRRMTPADLEEVMVIERAAFRHPWSPELFRRELEHDWSTILVAVEPLTSASGRGSERIVGFLIYWLVHDEVHILNVAVGPEHRRKGVACTLMGETERRAHPAGGGLLPPGGGPSHPAAPPPGPGFRFPAGGGRPPNIVAQGGEALLLVHEH